jgi:hypothetical protein
MDEQTAKLVIGAGATLGLVVWLISLQLYRKMADVPATELIETPVPGKTPAEALKSVIENAGRLGGQARLSRPSEHVFEISQWDCQTRIEARRSGGQTRLTTEIDDAKLRRKMLRILAIFVVLVMPATIVGVSAALWHFAAPSPTAAVRWQCLQVLQMSHALWPPFVLYFEWKRKRSLASDSVSNLLLLADAA